MAKILTEVVYKKFCFIFVESLLSVVDVVSLKSLCKYLLMGKMVLPKAKQQITKPTKQLLLSLKTALLNFSHFYCQKFQKRYAQ